MPRNTRMDISALRASELLLKATLDGAFTHTTTVIQSSELLEADDFYTGRATAMVVQADGSAAEAAVTDYDQSDHRLTLSPALPFTPVNGDKVYLKGADPRLSGLDVSALATAAALAVVDGIVDKLLVRLPDAATYGPDGDQASVNLGQSQLGVKIAALQALAAGATGFAAIDTVVDLTQALAAGASGFAALKAVVDTLNTKIGAYADVSSAETLFGVIKLVDEQVAV